MLNNLWLSECALIALLKNKRASVILHWRWQNWKSHYTFPFSFSFSTLINPQCTPWWVQDTWPRNALHFLMTTAPQIPLWELYLIQFWGRRWFLLWWAEATSVWRRKVKCSQYSSVKPNEGNRRLCSSLPTELMASQNLLPLLVTWATEIRNCFQEHKIGCCRIWSCVQWERERLQRPWLWVGLEPSLYVPTAMMGVEVWLYSVCRYSLYNQQV